MPPVGAATNYPPIPNTSPGWDLDTCHPVTTATVPPAQMDARIARIEAMAGSHVQGIGPCPTGQIDLALTPGSEWLAKRIRSTFGRVVLITIGLTSWDGHAGRSPRCGALPRWTNPPKGLTFSLVFRSNDLRIGHNLLAKLTASNRGKAPFEMDTGSELIGVLVKPGTHDVVGVYSGGIAGTGYELQAGPGATTSLTEAPGVIFGTARCDGGTGSALSPGRYQAVVLVMDESGTAPRYLTPPVTVRVQSP
jgi:hypothetical protein